MQLTEFNSTPHDQAVELLLGCCRCQSWAVQVADARPFPDIEALQSQAATVWAQANREQRLEAFAAHPLIGDVEQLRDRFANSGDRMVAEQGQVLNAGEDTLQELARLNSEYRDRHGFIFIVFASGKSAEEMLGLLEARIENETSVELDNAAAAQGDILQLRLSQLMS